MNPKRNFFHTSFQDSGRVPERSTNNGARKQERRRMLRRHATEAIVRARHGGLPARRAAGRALHRHGPAQQALPLGHHPGQLPGIIAFAVISGLRFINISKDICHTTNKHKGNLLLEFCNMQQRTRVHSARCIDWGSRKAVYLFLF